MLPEPNKGSTDPDGALLASNRPESATFKGEGADGLRGPVGPFVGIRLVVVPPFVSDVCR